MTNVHVFFMTGGHLANIDDDEQIAEGVEQTRALAKKLLAELADVLKVEHAGSLDELLRGPVKLKPARRAA